MNKNIAIAIALLMAVACKSTKTLTQHKYIPSAFHNVRFDMPMDKALKARPAMKKIEEVDFRTVFLEEIGKDGIKQVVYYFGTEGSQPLYEMIFIYFDEDERDEAAENLLGTPNYENGKEWMYDSGEGFRIHAWKFKTKLIVAGKIKGTEWEEE